MTPFSDRLQGMNNVRHGAELGFMFLSYVKTRGKILIDFK